MPKKEAVVEKVELVGTLMVPKTPEIVNLLYIISDDKKCYRTSLGSIEFNSGLIKNSLRVIFTTPTEQIGRFRWAYNVRLA